MLLHNLGKPITVTHWYMLELRSERTSEETIKRLGRAIRMLFQGEGVEVFIPVVERDLDTFTLMTECYIFIRADDANKIGKLRRVTGVQGVLSSDDSARVHKFLKVEDDYVQGLIRQCWDIHLKRAEGIKPGSWVRLLDGQLKGYCGTVLTVDNGRVMVKVEKKTKIIHQETSIHNLRDLSYVPPEHRVFYYSESVIRYLEEDPDAAVKALKPDLQFNEADLKAFLMCDDAPAPVNVVVTHGAALHGHTSRENTPTRFLRSLLDGGERSAAKLLVKVARAIRSKAIKSPKTATILWHVLRETIVAYHFPNNMAKPRKTYGTIKHIYGELTPMMVHRAIPDLPLRLLKAKVTKATMPVPTPVLRPSVSGVIRMALSQGKLDLDPVIQGIESKLKQGLIRAPKHLDSFASAIRTQVLTHFRQIHPNTTIVDLVALYGPGLRLSPGDLRGKFPRLEATIQANRDALSVQTDTHQVVDPVGIIQKMRKTPAAALAARTIITHS